jgi:hypothetical protein
VGYRGLRVKVEKKESHWPCSINNENLYSTVTSKEIKLKMISLVDDPSSTNNRTGNES